MKRLVLVSLILIGFAAVAAAALVQDSVLLTPNDTDTITGFCTVTAPVGLYISSLTLTGIDDYTEPQNKNNSGSNTNPDITSFSLQLINVSNTVINGTVTGASIVLDLDYGVTQIPEVVPRGVLAEPPTFGLLGVALVGVGFFARKKSKLSDPRR